ncbi:MAG: hypothetical protein ACRC62_31655 [Microcoleus sp.]
MNFIVYYDVDEIGEISEGQNIEDALRSIHWNLNSPDTFEEWICDVWLGPSIGS